jgi:hypothetical protein
METSPLPVKGCKFRPMLGAQGLWAGRDLYRATPAVTRDLGFSGLIRRTAPFGRLLQHTRGCGGSILTRILTGSMMVQQMNVNIRNEQRLWAVRSQHLRQIFGEAQTRFTEFVQIHIRSYWLSINSSKKLINSYTSLTRKFINFYFALRSLNLNLAPELFSRTTQNAKIHYLLVWYRSHLCSHIAHVLLN